MAYLKVVKKEYCAFLQVPTNSSVAHCPVQGECAQRVCSKKFWLNIDIIIEFFMTVSEFFEQLVILRPIVANFVWLKNALYFFVRLFLPSLVLVLSRLAHCSLQLQRV